MQSLIVDTSQVGIQQVIAAFKKVFKRRQSPLIEIAPWRAVALLRHFKGVDIDEYRARRGKEEGEAQFFFDNRPSDQKVLQQNLFMFNGACLLFQSVLNLGTTTPNSAFSTGPTLLTNSNAYLYVSDGGPTAITGTISTTGGSGNITTSSGSSGLSIGVNLSITGDSSSQVYTVVSGGPTAWVISPVYGGTTASGLAAGYFGPASHANTTFPGSTNVASQVADGGFPSNPFAAQLNAITGATNATPIVLTVSGADLSVNDIAHVVEVLGNTNANGVYVCNPASASSLTLIGSAGNAGYTSGGYCTKRSVFTMQSTFGATSGVFVWNAWGITNGNGSNKILVNLKYIGMGAKANGTSTALKVGIAIG